MALIDFTLSDARQFYSSMEKPLEMKGLTTPTSKLHVPINNNNNYCYCSLGNYSFLRGETPSPSNLHKQCVCSYSVCIPTCQQIVIKILQDLTKILRKTLNCVFIKS